MIQVILENNISILRNGRHISVVKSATFRACRETNRVCQFTCNNRVVGIHNGSPVSTLIRNLCTTGKINRILILPAKSVNNGSACVEIVKNSVIHSIYSTLRQRIIVHNDVNNAIHPDTFFVYAYVWNQEHDHFSEFGDIVVKSYGGGIRRLG